jgi:hypothetical protein
MGITRIILKFPDRKSEKLRSSKKAVNVFESSDSSEGDWVTPAQQSSSKRK